MGDEDRRLFRENVKDFNDKIFVRIAYGFVDCGLSSIKWRGV